MKKTAFTMAEILISLTIIGIIAAITLPALQSNINEKTWNTQRKALYSRMTQAISMMPALNGYGDGSTQEEEAHNATQSFIAELGKTLKINNVCDKDHLKDCGINVDDDNLFKVNNIVGNQISIPVPNLKVYYDLNQIDLHDEHPYTHAYTGAFETANGEYILVYYNPWCIGNAHRENDGNVMYDKVCATFVYDLNGTKGPNTVGKDVGIMSALYSSDSAVVAPMPLGTFAANNTWISYSDAVSACRAQDEDSRLPNLEEAIAMRMNYTLFKDDIPAADFGAWTNASVGANTAWEYLKTGYYDVISKDETRAAWCVKR